MEKKGITYSDTDLIIAWLENRLSSEEKLLFEQRMADSSDFKKQAEESRMIWQFTEQLKLQKEVDVVSRWQKLKGSLRFIRLRDKTWKVSKALAAIAAIPLLMTVYYYSQRLSVLENTPVEMIETKTAYGLVSSITLSDGTEVLLNSGSTLSYPRFFKGTERKVYLNGEGYFNVNADPIRRFDVEVPGNICVSAYGTKFSVNAYEDQAWVETVLAEGVIEVAKQNPDTTVFYLLNPGQMALATKDRMDMEVSDVNVYVKTAWKDGRMVFRRARMQEIAQRLSKHFNVDVQLQDEALLQYEYSATFTTETLTEILNLLAQSSPIQWCYIEPQKLVDFTYTRRVVVIKLRE